MRNPQKLIAFSIIFWVIVNLGSLLLFSEEFSRWIRFITSAFFFVVIVFNKPFSWKFFFTFLLFAICDFSAIFFENILFNAITFLSRTLAFIMVAYVGIARLKRIKINFFEFFVGIILIGINLYLLFELENMVAEKHADELYVPAFYVFCIIAILTMIIAVSYSNRYSSEKSLFYLNAVLWMICSDIAYFIAYYLDFHVFYYSDRFFNVLGTGFLALFAAALHQWKKEEYIGSEVEF